MSRPIRFEPLEGRATPAVIQGYVFEDENVNGVFEAVTCAGLNCPAPERGLAGVVVAFDRGADGTVDATATTDAAGRYTIADVPDGTHTLSAAPAGFTPTTSNPLTVTFSDGGYIPPPRPLYPARPPVAGRLDLPYYPGEPFDFGFARRALVVAGAFADDDGDGTQDPGEAVVPGATIRLDLGADGTADASRETDAGGSAVFTRVPDGAHAAVVRPPAGFAAVGPDTRPFTVTGGQTVAGPVFTLRRTDPGATAAVAVFVDHDGDGVRDPGESPAAGVLVALYREGDVIPAIYPPFGSVRTDAAGTATFTNLADGTHTVLLTVEGATVTTPPARLTVAGGVATPDRVEVGYRPAAGAATARKIAVGADAPGRPAGVFDATGRPAAGPGGLTVDTPTGVRTAAADVTGDGVDDVAVGSGPGATPVVRVIDGATGAELFAVRPFEESFTGGVFVALGDLTADGRADLVVTPDRGGGPRVRVFDGATFAVLDDFFGIEDPAFRGGARAAVGDVDRDGAGDVVVAAGAGGGPRVAAFDGSTLRPDARRRKLFNDFFVFEQTLRDGVFVAAGDVDGDGWADVIAGGGPGGGPRVLAVSGRGLLSSDGAAATPVANFFAGGADADRTGAPVAVKDLDADGRADVIAAYRPAPGAAPRLSAYLGRDLAPGGGAPRPHFDVEPYPGFTGGVFVG